MVSAASVLIPFYIYPSPGKWDALHSAISANPKLNFTVIVNPDSGPGYAPWWPNSDYIRELPKLNAAPNVRTVGYVRTNKTIRDIGEVQQDIAMWAARSSDSTSGLGVKGIFFDETPNLYSEQVKTYLDSITQTVKSTSGILSDKTVIHNPGTAVYPELAKPGPDITTIVEQSYTAYLDPESQKWAATNPYPRTRTSYMIYAVPKDMTKNLVKSIKDKAEYLFITDRTVDVYNDWGSTWTDFVAAMVE